MAPDNEIVRKIKQGVKETDADAQIILYGSRALGTARKDSDWDILILVNSPSVTIKEEQVFRHRLYDVELETGQVISTFVYSVSDWKTKMFVTPLFQNIQKEGIYL